MNQRRFEHANNPCFTSDDSVLLLPFGRRSFLPVIGDSLGGEPVLLDETTDREIYRLNKTPSPITLMYSGMGSPAAANALEMAAAGARLGLCTGALLFCTDNVTVTDEEDRRYRGLADPRVRRAFEVGLDVATRVLAEPMS